MWPFENAASILLAHWLRLQQPLSAQLRSTWHMVGGFPRSLPQGQGEEKTLVLQPAACPGRCSARPRDLDQPWERRIIYVGLIWI